MTASGDADGHATARRLLAGATGCDAANIEDDAAIGTFEPWDSLAHMRLILAIEEETGAEISPDLVVEIGTLGQISEYLRRSQEPA